MSAPWLAGFAFWIGLPVGALGLLFLHDLTGGAWGEPLRPPLLRLAGLLPGISALFLPLLFVLPELYPWARPGGAGAGLYLSPGFFTARAVLTLVLWNALALAERRRPGPRLAAPGLILLAFTGTFAAIDWFMSIEAPWLSSAYGLMVEAGWLLAALAAALLLAEAPPGRPRPAAMLLLALVMVAAYIAFMQYLIVWEENLTREIPWYLRRGARGWGAVAVAAALLGFALPFGMLLSRRLKEGGRGLVLVAALVLVGRLLDTQWLVLPPFGGVGLLAPGLAATAGLGGLALLGRRLGP